MQREEEDKDDGRIFTTRVVSDELWAFDPHIRVWTWYAHGCPGESPSPRWLHSAFAVEGRSRLIVIGGAVDAEVRAREQCASYQFSLPRIRPRVFLTKSALHCCGMLRHALGSSQTLTFSTSRPRAGLAQDASASSLREDPSAWRSSARLRRRVRRRARRRKCWCLGAAPSSRSRSQPSAEFSVRNLKLFEEINP